jgi:hypothetical protein
MQQIANFLERMSLVQPGSAISSDGNICYIPCTGILSRVVIAPIDGVFDIRNVRAKDEREAVLVVTEKYNSCIETLRYSETSVLDLMYNNVLLVHMDGIKQTLGNIHKHSHSCLYRTYDEAADRRSILEEIRDMEKSIPMYSSRFENPLEQFGVEYINVLFLNYIAHNRDPVNTIYVSRSETSVIASYLSDDIVEKRRRL